MRPVAWSPVKITRAPRGRWASQTCATDGNSSTVVTMSTRVSSESVETTW